MSYFTTQGSYDTINDNYCKNIEGFADTINPEDLTNPLPISMCDNYFKQLKSEFDSNLKQKEDKLQQQEIILMNSQKNLLTAINEKDECAKKITEFNKQFQTEKSNCDLKLSELSKNFENTINNITIERNNLIKKVNDQESCDVLIKQSYSDFDKKYQLQKDAYEAKIKEQIDVTNKTMQQFLQEKEDWTKQFNYQKSELTKSIQEEKNKLENTKIIFEEKIKKLESAIAEISLDIKKI